MNKYNDSAWDHFEDIEKYESPIQYIMINSHMIPLYVLIKNIETNINLEEYKNSKIQNQQIYEYDYRYIRSKLYNYIIEETIINIFNNIVTFIATIRYF